MKETKTDKAYRKHTVIKTVGITALVLLMLVGIASAAPFAYVINEDLPSGINVIDTATNKVISYVGGSLSGPGNLTGPGVTVNPAGTKVYVTNSDKNTVSVIDTATNKVTATVNVGSSPYGVAVSYDGKKVYVANSGINTVSVIDTTTNKVTATVNVGSSPCGVAVTPDGDKVYVTNSGNYSIHSNTASVIDTSTNKVTATVNVGNNPYGVAVTPDGKNVYVANRGYSTSDSSVSVIDTTINKVTATVKFGSTPDGVALRPNEVAITPDGKKVYVAGSGSDYGCFVPVIDTSTNKVITNIDDGVVSNIGIAITPDGKKVYVLNWGHTGAGYGASVIDTATNKVTGYVESMESMLIPIAFGQFIGPSIKPTPQKPVAAFSASPTSGSIPLKVQFTEQSTNSPTSWKWDFGDGTTSTTHNPLHTYIKAGSLTVNLTATNAAGSGKVTKTSYIVVTKPVKPVAAFSATPTSGTKPLKVQFTDKSTGSPTSWKWDFGDKSTSTTRNPAHKYTKAGKYTVSLTVKNAAGSNTKKISNFITVK
jgi:YVTN family beta-propeller protein